MATRRTLVVRWEQRQELAAARDHDRRPSVRERCAARLMIAVGPSAAAVGRQGLLKEGAPDTVYAGLDHSQAEGMAGVVGHAPGGYPRSRLRASPAAHPRASG
jgi:hypothetical protein